MKVTYIYHSGYLVETESATLLFDYYKGELPAFPAEKPLFVFASHKHRDHFNFRAMELQNHPGGAYFIFGNDICLNEKYLERHGIDPVIREHMHRMAPHTQLCLKDIVSVHTLKSTDAGVAFYVKVGDERIYHAGDLNWWHWAGERDAFNAVQEKEFKAEMQYLKELLQKENGALDAAFVPLDPRLGTAYSYGMDYFLLQIPANKVYPMHMWDDYEIINRYQKQCEENTLFSHNEHKSITNPF